MSEEHGNSVEDLVDRRIEEKLSQKDKEIEQLRDEVQRLKNSLREEEFSSDQNLSRRQFLKKIGVGAAGLGGLGLVPAVAQLKLTKDGIFKDSSQLLGGDTSTTFSQSIDMNGNDINSAGTLSANKASVGRADDLLDFHVVERVSERNPTISIPSRSNHNYDTVLIEGKIASGTQGGNTMDMRVNGHTGTDYHYTERGSSGLNRVSSNDRFRIATSPAGGGNDRDQPFRMSMPISYQSSGDYSLYVSCETGAAGDMVQGKVNLDGNDVNELNFFSSNSGFILDGTVILK